MKKLHKLLMTSTVIVSIFGCNIHSILAQNSPEFKAIDSIKDKNIWEHLKFVRTDELADRGENQRK